MYLQMENIQLVESSFKEVASYSDAFITRFYDLFLNSDPRIAALFRRDNLRQQRQKLLFALVMIIENLRDPSMTRYLIDLGQVHIEKYGVRPEFVPLFRDALLTTFAEFLGERWTPEHRYAWESAFKTILTHMFNVM